MTPEATRWSVAGASARGPSHAKTATPCQDAFAWERVNDDWLVLAVADGAGSAPISDVGAKVAVHAALAATRSALCESSMLRDDAFSAHAWKVVLEGIAIAARDAVIATGVRIGRAKRDLASTLIVVIAGPQVTAAIQIGDGASVMETEDGAIVSLTKPFTPEFLGESVFLVSGRALELAHVVALPSPCTSLALFSDGLQLLTLEFPTWLPFEPFFRTLFHFSRSIRDDADAASAQLETLLTSDRIRKRSDDDVTLLVANRAPAAMAPTSPANVAVGGAPMSPPSPVLVPEMSTANEPISLSPATASAT